MSGSEDSSNKHCIVCAVGIFCPEHSTICMFSADEKSALFVCFHIFCAFFELFCAVSCTLKSNDNGGVEYRMGGADERIDVL